MGKKQKALYQDLGYRHADPIWMLMKNPLFVGKINTLLCQAREKWMTLERAKVQKNPFYQPVKCPLTLDALTWVSAYLKYYFIQDGDDSIDSYDDLVRIFNILISRA